MTDAPWRRLHPLTPLLRGGRFGLLLLVVVGQQGAREWRPGVLLAVLGAGVPLGLLAGWLAWRATRYRVAGDELQVDSGVLLRRSRRVPLARVQAVDLVRPFYARFLGLAELRLEVVGGGDAEAPLAFLPEDEAVALRTRLLELASGRPAADETPERVLVQVPTGPLVWSTLLGPPVIAAVALVVLAPVVLALDPGLLIGVVPLLLAVGSWAARRLLSEYGFTVAETPDGLRLRHGLLDTRSSTIPPDRVQAVRITQPLLWRRPGWVRVEVDVAGYARGDGEQTATSALLPVAPRELGLALVERVLGRPLPVADRPVPGAARWRAPLQAPRLRVGVDDAHLVATSGVLTRTTDVAPLRKVQSVRSTQGPWERRLGLATLHLDTAGRRLPGAVARHRAQDEGLLEEAVARARDARRAG